VHAVNPRRCGNLVNAARLFEDQPALATIRFLQTLAGNAGANQMLVMNDLSAFAPAVKARGAPRAAQTEET
jgi:hypothetical protein